MKYFISDCHIGGGNPTDQFRVKEKYFVKLLDHIMAESVGNEVQELILLGDSIDFLEIPLDPDLPPTASYNEQALCQLEDFVFKTHPGIFDAMSRFINAGHSIFYVWGNHDYPLRFGNVNEALAQRILKTTRDRTDYGKFTVSDYYLSHRMTLYAEHGHRFDALNLHHGGREPVGSLLVRNFITKWENRCYAGNIRDVFGDKMAEAILADVGDGVCPPGELRPFSLLRSVRPRGNILDFITRLVRYGVFPLDVQEEMHEDLANVLVAAGREAQGWVLEALGFRGLKALRKLVLRFRISDNTPILLRKGAEQILKNIHNERDLDFNPFICILGHSHFIDARAFPEKEFIPRLENYPLETYKEYYFNIASWMDVTLVDHQGRVGIHYRECPYLRLRQDPSGKIFADLKDAAQPDHPPIDIEKYRRRYIEYETEYE